MWHSGKIIVNFLFLWCLEAARDFYFLEMLIYFIALKKVLFYLNPVIYDMLKSSCTDYSSKIIVFQMSYRLTYIVI